MATRRGPSPVRRRRPPLDRRPPARSGVAVWLVLLFGLAMFALGRFTLPPPPPQPDRPAASEPLVTATSTAGLCPCPAPPKPRPARRRLARREVPPRAVRTATRADPTAGTARFLRDQVGQLSRCAPSSGEPVRLHLEVEVAPPGEIVTSRITNLDPVPPAVARCVLDAVEALAPPGFDAVDAKRFALTVVL